MALSLAQLLMTLVASARRTTADIAGGLRLFRQKGNCQACHGWLRRRPQDGQPDARRRQPPRIRDEPRIADHHHQVRTAGHGGCRRSTSSPTATGECFGLKAGRSQIARARARAISPATLQTLVELLADFHLARAGRQRVRWSAPSASSSCGSDVETCRCSRSKA